MIVSNDCFKISLSLSLLQANSARDALAKALFVRTTVAVMRRINTLLKGAGAQSPQKPHHRSIPKSDTLPPHTEVSDIANYM